MIWSWWKRNENLDLTSHKGKHKIVVSLSAFHYLVEKARKVERKKNSKHKKTYVYDVSSHFCVVYVFTKMNVESYVDRKKREKPFQNPFSQILWAYSEKKINVYFWTVEFSLAGMNERDTRMCK